MNKDHTFPDEGSWISLFNDMPAYADPIDDVIPFYNEMTIKYESDDDSLELIVQPSCGDLKIDWKQGERQIALIEVSSIVNYSINEDASSFTAEFATGSGIAPLELTIRPRINIKWGTKKGFEDRPKTR